jgi:hypothetical protein
MSGHAAPPPPPKADAGGHAAPAAHHTSLAELIYIELVGRAFLRVENAAVIKPEPDALAALSIQLAETWQKVAAKHKVDTTPVSTAGYELTTEDVASWLK